MSTRCTICRSPSRGLELVTLGLCSLLAACSPRSELTTNQQKRYDESHETIDLIYGSITGVVVTSPTVVTELKRDNTFRQDEDFIFFVPSLRQIGLAEELLLELHQEVANSDLTAMSADDHMWMKDAVLNLAVWDSFLRSYVGLRSKSKDYLLCHFMHPDDIEALDEMCGFEDSWKRVFGFPSSTAGALAGTFQMMVNLTDASLGLESDRTVFLETWSSHRARPLPDEPNQ